MSIWVGSAISCYLVKKQLKTKQIKGFACEWKSLKNDVKKIFFQCFFFIFNGRLKRTKEIFGYLKKTAFLQKSVMSDS